MINYSIYYFTYKLINKRYIRKHFGAYIFKMENRNTKISDNLSQKMRTYYR